MRVPNPIYVACRLAQKISVVFFAGPWEVSGDGTAADAPRDSMRSSYKSWKPIDTGDARGLIHVRSMHGNLLYQRPTRHAEEYLQLQKMRQLWQVELRDLPKPFKQPQWEGCYEYIGNLCSLQGVHVLLAGVPRDSRGRQCMHHMFASHDPGLAKDPWGATKKKPAKPSLKKPAKSTTSATVTKKPAKKL